MSNVTIDGVEYAPVQSSGDIKIVIFPRMTLTGNRI